MSLFAEGKKEQGTKILYGWNGNLSTEQFLENSVTFQNLRSVIYKYTFSVGNNNLSNAINVAERKFLYPDGKCFDLNIKLNANVSHNIGKEAVLTLILNNKKDTEVRVHITDPHREHFLSDYFTFHGQDVKKKLDETNVNSMDLYKLKIKERIGDMRDPEANCNDYDDKSGFKDCVMEAVKEKFLTRYGCSPPWFTENIEDVCHGNMSQDKWKQVSDEIFPTMDHSFLKV